VDADSFDSLARFLTATGSRRRTLALALSGALAPVLAQGDAEAHDPSRKCKRKSGKQMKTCLRKAKKHNATHTTQAGPTCSDGIKNGSETGVDCGGGCKRCATGQGCTSTSDCASALCSGGTCQTCTVSPDTCGSGCNCRQPDSGGSSVCTKNTGTGSRCDSSACPPGEICINNVGTRDCFKPCGAP
jgi:hypothetical protein